MQREGLDMLLLSFVLVYILKEFHLSPVEGGNLTLATTIGMLIGSYLFGFIADLFGRIRTMAFTILLFSLATALIYFATDYWQLLILRFLVEWVLVVNSNRNGHCNRNMV